jgi:hypothetical protein
VSLTSQFALASQHMSQTRPDSASDMMPCDAIDPDAGAMERGRPPQFVLTLETVWGDAWRLAVLEGVGALPCMWYAKELGCKVQLDGCVCPQTHQDVDLERLWNLVDFPRTCARCGIVALSLCSRCRGVFFCGRACQRAHWPQHRAVCHPGAAAAPAPAYTTPATKQV